MAKKAANVQSTNAKKTKKRRPMHHYYLDEVLSRRFAAGAGGSWVTITRRDTMTPKEIAQWRARKAARTRARNRQERETAEARS